MNFQGLSLADLYQSADFDAYVLACYRRVFINVHVRPDYEDVKQEVMLHLARLNTLDRYDASYNISFNAFLWIAIYRRMCRIRTLIIRQPQGTAGVDENDLSLSYDNEADIAVTMTLDRMEEYLAQQSAEAVMKAGKRVSAESYWHQVFQMLRNGETSVSIARALGVSNSRVWSLKKKMFQVLEQQFVGISA